MCMCVCVLMGTCYSLKRDLHSSAKSVFFLLFFFTLVNYWLTLTYSSLNWTTQNSNQDFSCHCQHLNSQQECKTSTKFT